MGPDWTASPRSLLPLLCDGWAGYKTRPLSAGRTSLVAYACRESAGFVAFLFLFSESSASIWRQTTHVPKQESNTDAQRRSKTLLCGFRLAERWSASQDTKRGTDRYTRVFRHILCGFVWTDSYEGKWGCNCGLPETHTHTHTHKQTLTNTPCCDVDTFTPSGVVVLWWRW